MLKNKFGQSDFIKSSLFRELHSIPPVSNSDLSAVVEKVECVLRQLEALKESVDGTFLETMLNDKVLSWVFEKAYETKDASSSVFIEDEICAINNNHI